MKRYIIDYRPLKYIYEIGAGKLPSLDGCFPAHLIMVDDPIPSVQSLIRLAGDKKVNDFRFREANGITMLPCRDTNAGETLSIVPLQKRQTYGISLGGETGINSVRFQ